MSTKTLAAVDLAGGASADAPVPDNELVRLLNKRGTVRAYKSDPIPDAWIEAMVAAAQRAPTSSNIQAYSIVVVRDPEIKKQLAVLAGNQQHIIDCPVFFALCADQTRLVHACAMHGKEYPGRTFEAGLVSSIDAALVGMTLSLVVDSFGLSNVMIGAMRNNATEVAKLLKLPPRCYVVFGLCVGWAKKGPVPKPRQPQSGVVHYDTYDAKNREQAVAEYDQDLAKYYRSRGAETPDAAWTGPIADKFSDDKRKKLKQQLNELGFPLE